MRAVLQRVLKSSVSIDSNIVGKIDKGIMALVAFDETDSEKDFAYMLDKITNLRIFEDEDGKMNLSVKDLEYGVLIVPNFTLYADGRKGRRPSFSLGAKPDTARKMFSDFITYFKDNYSNVQSGIFQADMQVNILNDGPVTILLDSTRLF